MKKLMIVLVFMLTATSVSFAAAFDDMSVYLRRDVFDAKMDAFMNEIRGEFRVMNEKIDALSRRVDDNKQELEKRIADVRSDVYIMFVVLGVIVSLPITQRALKWFEERREAKKKFVTLEDVERLIAEHDAKLAS